MGAVSPAVVVPRMVKLMEEGYGTKKGTPQMILAGASCDDIFVIVLFTTFLQMAQGGHANAKDFINIPISIVSGIVLGCIVGYLLYRFFELAYKKNHCVRNSTKLIVILGMSCLLLAIEEWVSAYVAVSGLLAVVSMACMLKVKSTTFVSKRLSEKFGKLWIAAEVILFVLVGAAVDIRYMAKAGAMALLMIGAACCSAQSVSASVCWYEAYMEGAAILYHCVSSEGYRAGGDWVSSSGSRAFLRYACAIRCGYGNRDHSANRRARYRQHI